MSKLYAAVNKLSRISLRQREYVALDEVQSLILQHTDGTIGDVAARLETQDVKPERLHKKADDDAGTR